MYKYLFFDNLSIEKRNTFVEKKKCYFDFRIAFDIFYIRALKIEHYYKLALDFTWIFYIEH